MISLMIEINLIIVVFNMIFDKFDVILSYDISIRQIIYKPCLLVRDLFDVW